MDEGAGLSLRAGVSLRRMRTARGVRQGMQAQMMPREPSTQVQIARSTARPEDGGESVQGREEGEWRANGPVMSGGMN